jgi:hypothetical protein
MYNIILFTANACDYTIVFLTGTIINVKSHLIHKDVPVYVYLLYVFFWVIPRSLNFICRRFGTLCLFHPHRQVGVDD